MCVTTLISSEEGWRRTSTKLNGTGWADACAAIPTKVAATPRRIRCSIVLEHLVRRRLAGTALL
jgi:hypothetical protein